MNEHALSRSIRSDDVFVVGYPKSGTNFVCLFMACCLAETRYGESHTKLHLGNHRKYCPNLNHQRDLGPLPHAELPSPRIMSLHTTGYDSRLSRVVYVVRHPGDVLVSYYHYHCRQDPALKNRLTIDQFIEQNDFWPGDWGHHVGSWLSHKSPNHLWVFYEKMRTEPEKVFPEVVKFCGLDVSDDLFGDVVEYTRFENATKLEDAHGDHRGERHEGDQKFVRSGKVGGYRSELLPATVELVHDRYRPLLDRLGYPEA